MRESVPVAFPPAPTRPVPFHPRSTAAPHRGAAAALVVLGLAGPLAAQDGAAVAGLETRRATGPFAELLDGARGARAWLEFRARYEGLRDDRFPRRAHAPTLRTAFGLETAPVRGLVLGAELENTTVLGSARYDDGLNGQGDRPLVLDPEGTTLNRVYAAFEDASGARVRGGRIRYQLHDGRLVGRDPWRQNDQVYDGAVLALPALGLLELEYAFLGAVNRPGGDDAPTGRESMTTHVVDLRAALGPGAVLSAYLVDADLGARATGPGAPPPGATGPTAAGIGGAPSTLGLRAEGRLELTAAGTATYRADLARQRGEDGLSRDLSASYLDLGLGYEHRFGGGWRGTLGFELERLGGARGPGEAPFLTPLASTNDFNGWLDRFAVTPDSGLIDRRLRLGLAWREVALEATLHDFEADRGGADLGREWDLALSWRPVPELTLGLRVADFEGGAGDASSAALWIDFRPLVGAGGAGRGGLR